MAMRFTASLGGAGILLPLLAGLAQAQTPSSPTATRLDAVTVSATRTEQAAIDRPEAVTVVRREDIEKRQPGSVVELLRDIPGASFSGGPRGTAVRPTIRGLGGERVVVRLDNARQNFNAEHKGRIFVEPEFLRQVDVLRGPGSTLFGSGALGGVMNMTTVDATDFLKPGQMMGGRVSAGYASASDKKRGSLMAYARPMETLDFLVGGSAHTQADLRHGNNTHLPYSAERNRSALFKVGINPDTFHRITLSALRYDGDEKAGASAEDPLNVRTNPTVDRDTKQDTYTLSWNYKNPADKLFDVQATLYRNQADIEEKTRASVRHDTRKQTVNGVDVANTSRFSFSDSAHNRLTYGVEYMEEKQEGRRDGSPTPGFYPDATMKTTGVFVQDEITLFTDWTLTAGVRHDRFDLSPTDRTGRDGSSTSPKAALSWRVTPWFMPYVSYAEAFRAPSLKGLYNQGTHFIGRFGPNTFVPNPNLRPEKARNAELGASFRFQDLALERDSLRLKVSGFENRIKDYIEQTTVDKPGGTTTTSNVPNARIRGVELEAAYDAGIVFASLGASKLRGDNRSSHTPLESIPAAKAVATIGTRLPGTDLEAGWRTHMVAAQNRAETSKKSSGYAIHDVFVSWAPEQFNDALRVNLTADNLFDRYYKLHESAIYAAGRDIRLSAVIQF